MPEIYDPDAAHGAILIKTSLRVLAVFLFFAVWVAHAATGFLHSQLSSRAFDALDGLTKVLFTQPFGHRGGAVVLALLGLLCCWLAYRRGLQEG